ncbi:MAG: hypothetical protein KF841_06765 [Phycisphaerae bacterium]|nr:hypothetical protein [Phycisphaerae bacterium]
MKPPPQRSESIGTACRFVLLFHRDPRGDHYDLMIQAAALHQERRGDPSGPGEAVVDSADERLATWKMSDPPDSIRGVPLACQRIADHRAVYLSYEGPISGDRGTVTRYDSGQCEIEKLVSGDCILLRFFGQRLHGRFQLEHVADSDAEWVLSVVAD